jgi:hypothetical protein
VGVVGCLVECACLDVGQLGEGGDLEHDHAHEGDEQREGGHVRKVVVAAAYGDMETNMERWRHGWRDGGTDVEMETRMDTQRRHGHVGVWAREGWGSAEGEGSVRAGTHALR